MFFETTTKNGLKVIGENRVGAASTSFAFFVRTGARDETPTVSGVSHFLEHMMFKGTKKRSALEISYELGAIGAQANAYTSEENTVYYSSLLPEYLEKGIELFSDMLQPALSEEDFNLEKQVILEEIALYQDKPRHVLFEKAQKDFFQDQGVGNSILGSIESITALTAAQMREYFEARYNVKNIILGVSGDFNWEEFVALAERYTSNIGNTNVRDTNHKYSIQRNYKLPNYQASSGVIYKKNLQTNHLCLLMPGPSAQDPTRYAMSVLTVILADYSSSKTFWELVDTGLAESVAIDGDEKDQIGSIISYLNTSPDNYELAKGKLLKILKEARDFTEEDLEIAKVKLLTRLAISAESSSRRLMSIGYDYLYHGKYHSLEEELKNISKVTKGDILSALKQYPLEPIYQLEMFPEVKDSDQ